MTLINWRTCWAEELHRAVATAVFDALASDRCGYKIRGKHIRKLCEACKQAELDPVALIEWSFEVYDLDACREIFNLNYPPLPFIYSAFTRRSFRQRYPEQDRPEEIRRRIIRDQVLSQNIPTIFGFASALVTGTFSLLWIEAVRLLPNHPRHGVVLEHQDQIYPRSNEVTTIKDRAFAVKVLLDVLSQEGGRIEKRDVDEKDEEEGEAEEDGGEGERSSG